MFYPKIETLYARSEDGGKRLIEGQFRDKTVQYLADNLWYGTEKVDGTNVGVVWDGGTVSYQGHSAKSEMPKHLVEALDKIFGSDAAEEMFEQKFGATNMTLFGEGYGPKIGPGGKYRKDISFILFDVFCEDTGTFLPRDAVEEIAQAFGIRVAPIVFVGNLREAVAYVKGHPNSVVSEAPDAEMEGIVCRPMVEINDRCGKRVIVKVKWKDFKPEQ